MPPLAIGGALALGGAVTSAISNRNQSRDQANQANANRDQAFGSIAANDPEGLLNRFQEGSAIGDYLRNEETGENFSNTSSSSSSTSRRFIQDNFKGTDQDLKDFWNSLMSGDEFSTEGMEKLNASKVNDTFGNVESIIGDKVSGLGLGAGGAGAALGVAESARARDIVRGRLGAERESLGIRQQGAQGLQQLLGLAGIGTKTNTSSSSNTTSGNTGPQLAPGQQLLLNQFIAGNNQRAGLGAPATSGGIGNALLGGVGGMAGALGGQILGQQAAGFGRTRP